MKYLISLLICTFLISCDDDDDTFVPSYEAVRDCHHSNVWNNTSLSDFLVGTWDQRRTFNPWTNEVSEVAPGTQTIILKGDGTATVKMGSEVFEDLSWILERFSDPFQLYIDGSAFALNGWISACGEALIIGNSFVDGPDDLYIRLE